MKMLNTNVKSKRLWGFDAETYGNYNKFIMVSLYGDENVNKSFYKKEDFIEYLIRNSKPDKCDNIGFSNGYVVATNLNFDMLAVFAGTKYFGDLDIFIRNSNMILARFCTHVSYEWRIIKDKRVKYAHKRYIDFIDTFSFAKFSVEKWGKILKIPKLPKPGFLGKKPRNGAEMATLERYNKQDSKISYLAMKLIQKGYNDLGGNLKITVSSTSLDLFRRKYFKGIWFKPTKPCVSYLNMGYYGGRTEVIKRGNISGLNLKYYDVNSLYPYVMQKEYPDPNSCTFSRCVKMSTIEKYEGVAHVVIETPPSMYIPYIPFRKPDKLIFPVGAFEGYYTFFELRRAIKLGYKIREIKSAYIYLAKIKPFKRYVTDLYALRLKYKAIKSPLELIIKLSLNSLYGKFAQKTDFKEIIVHESKVTMEMLNKAAFMPDRTGDFFIFKEPYKDIPHFINPIMAIYTTAYARDVLYNYMRSCNVFYYDTDSIICDSDLITGLDLGALKHEFTINNGVLIKPKMYIINETGRCKGIRSFDRSVLNALIVDNKTKVRRFTKFKECNRRGIAYNRIIEFYKEIDLEDNKRVWRSKFNPEILQDSKPIIV